MTVPERFEWWYDGFRPAPDGAFTTWDAYATLAAKCEALERERDELAVELQLADGGMTTRAEALAARVRSLEEALRKIAEGYSVNDPEALPSFVIARAALSAPREEGKT